MAILLFKKIIVFDFKFLYGVTFCYLLSSAAIRTIQDISSLPREQTEVQHRNRTDISYINHNISLLLLQNLLFKKNNCLFDNSLPYPSIVGSVLHFVYFF